MKRRRVATVTAVITLVVIAAACTSKSSTPNGGGGSAPITLTLWHGYGKVESNNGVVNYEAKSLTDLGARRRASAGRWPSDRP